MEDQHRPELEDKEPENKVESMFEQAWKIAKTMGIIFALLYILSEMS